MHYISKYGHTTAAYLFQSISTFYEFRNSRPEVFCKKDVLRNFAKFTGKHLRQSLFFNKLWTQGFSCEFCDAYINKCTAKNGWPMRGNFQNILAIVY